MGKAAKPLGPTGEFFRRRDEWRKHPLLTVQFRHALPGLGLGCSAFAIYCVAEYAYDNFYAPARARTPAPAPAPPSPAH